MESTTMHWTARRYLMARHDDLRREYGRLSGGGRAAGGYHQTEEARRISSRRHTADALRVEVERLDPDRLPTADVLAGLLIAAADTADSVFLQPPLDEVAARAIAGERQEFAARVRHWAAQRDLRADPLPYRRVLTTGESAALRAKLEDLWGVRDSYWHPLLGDDVPQDVLVLTDTAMLDDTVERIRGVLHRLGRHRVAEMREDMIDYLLDVELFTPEYTGVEGLWTDDRHDWIAYASHEGTVAFGGLLATELTATVPDVDTWRWPGWPSRHPG